MPPPAPIAPIASTAAAAAAAAPPAAARRWPWPPLVGASVGLHAAALGSALLLPDTAAWAAGAVLLDHALLTGAGLWPRSTWLGPNVRRLPAACAARGELAITLDDGPDPEVTPAVLDLLAAAGARVTFICIAERARHQGALLRRLVDAGHSVQNHSLHHRHHFSLFGPRRLAAEIAGAQALLADLTGVAPHSFRAPAGLRSPLLDPVLHRLGLHLVSWTRRGFDTRDGDAARVLARLGGGLKGGLAGGDILLLHDGHAVRTAAGRPVLLDVLPALLQAVRAAGLRPVTLADALPPRSVA